MAHSRALIGYTGFVGSNLARARPFTHLYNSRNIGEIDGMHFDEVVCAGVSAVKWLANKEPEADWAAIESLIGHLQRVAADRFTLVSTVDVYGTPIAVDETHSPDTGALHPYGLHRLKLESLIAETFERHLVVRLPALFGVGLKKNAIFDLMNNNQTDRIGPNSQLQWYPMQRFADDLDLLLASGHSLINVTAEPISIREIHDRFFPGVPIGSPDLPAQHYDVRTIYDYLLGGTNGYHLNAEKVFDSLAKYLNAEQH
ncbi:MAG TPA: hypothetical protein VGG99_30100 [Acetobacteraceae bacterium]|jgi:hypothetical protein